MVASYLTHPFRSIAFLCLLTPLLWACGGAIPGAEDVQQAICEPLGSLGTAIAELESLGAEVTAADAKAVKEQVDGPVGLVRTANQALNADAVTDLLTRYDELAAAIDAVPDDQTLGDTAAEISATVAELQSTLDEVASRLSCP